MDDYSPAVVEDWMQRALKLARATQGLASPNPQVGCVLERDGVVLGEGAHVYDAFDHAEIVALQQASARGNEVAGATAWVTLEPCSHHGRTGPCADALIAAGIGRVVIATQDPNPQVSGQGIARLRHAGVKVELGASATEARALNNGFAKFIQTGLPLVTLKAALSVDGMLAPPPTLRTPGETFWLTGAEARVEVQRMRHAADAVLTGIGTVLADDPLLTDRSGLPRRRALLRVVLDSELRIPLTSRLLHARRGDVLIVCGAGAPAERVALLESRGAQVIAVSGNRGRLDLHEVLKELGRRKLLRVLLECGSRLNGAFLAADLVDAAALFYAEAELGAGAVPFAEGFGPPFLVEQRLRNSARGAFGADVCVSGMLRDPWNRRVR